MRTPAFQFYPNDWLSSTQIALMTPAQEGAYIHLLCVAWNDPHCSLPANDEELSVLSRMGEEWLKGGSIKVKNCFVPHPTIDGRIVNLRLIAEREKQERWREKSKIGGVKSAESRRNNKLKGGSQMVDQWLPDGCNQTSTLQSSSSSSKEEEKNTKKRFTKPTVGEVEAYAFSIGYRINGDGFVNHYEAKGWRIGTSPMRSWKAAVKTWKGKASGSELFSTTKAKPVTEDQLEAKRVAQAEKDKADFAEADRKMAEFKARKEAELNYEGYAPDDY